MPPFLKRVSRYSEILGGNTWKCGWSNFLWKEFGRGTIVKNNYFALENSSTINVLRLKTLNNKCFPIKQRQLAMETRSTCMLCFDRIVQQYMWGIAYSTFWAREVRQHTCFALVEPFNNTRLCLGGSSKNTFGAMEVTSIAPNAFSTHMICVGRFVQPYMFWLWEIVHNTFFGWKEPKNEKNMLKLRGERDPEI